MRCDFHSKPLLMNIENPPLYSIVCLYQIHRRITFMFEISILVSKYTDLILPESKLSGMLMLRHWGTSNMNQCDMTHFQYSI